MPKGFSAIGSAATSGISAAVSEAVGELSTRPQLYSVSGALSFEEFGAKATNP